MASPDLAAAIATLLNDDQERILALASGLRAPNRTIESRVQGTSMGPGLAPGMRIRIDMSPRDHYPLGGVVAFVGGNRLIVHRLVHQGAEYVLTRGDARLAPDAPVKREQIVGLVTAAATRASGATSSPREPARGSPMRAPPSPCWRRASCCGQALR